MAYTNEERARIDAEFMDAYCYPKSDEECEKCPYKNVLKCESFEEDISDDVCDKMLKIMEELKNDA